MKFLVLLILNLHLCCSYKLLLVFPVPGKSHAILGEGFERHLLRAGHEVTHITPVPGKPQKNLRQIDVSSHFKMTPEDIFNLEYMMKNTMVISPHVAKALMHKYANATIMDPAVQKLLNDPTERFDAVIAEWMFNELYSGFAAVFNCPLIWSSSMEPHGLVLELINEPLNTAYTANNMATNEPPYTFVERVKELSTYLYDRYLIWALWSGYEKTFTDGFSRAAEMRGRKLPTLEDASYNGSLMFGNSHFSFGQAISLPQNYIPIVGYHIEDKINPLPADLQQVMDASKNGVIYFSMGSMLKSKSLPENVKRELLDMFSGLKQTVIWKFEEDLPNLPKNVHIIQWAPQQSILAHPNCVLFITHGGLLSITESMHFGVPTIGIPMFADQFVNVKRAVNRGFAREVKLTYNIATDLKEAIQEILSNPKYSERIKEISAIYHDRPMSPAQNLVYWTDYVIRNKGAPHLRSPALFTTWYQKLYLDLLALIVIGIVILVLAVKKVLLVIVPKKGKKAKRS